MVMTGYGWRISFKVRGVPVCVSCPRVFVFQEGMWEATWRPFGSIHSLPQTSEPVTVGKGCLLCPITGLNLRVSPNDGLQLLALAVRLAPPLDKPQEFSVLDQKRYQVVTFAALHGTTIM